MFDVQIIQEKQHEKRYWSVEQFIFVDEMASVMGNVRFYKKFTTSFHPKLNQDVNVFQRKFVNEIRRCEEMERQLSEL